MGSSRPGGYACHRCTANSGREAVHLKVVSGLGCDEIVGRLGTGFPASMPAAGPSLGRGSRALWRERALPLSSPGMSQAAFQPWTVAVTRDESPGGALHAALRAAGTEPRSCVVMEAQPPADTLPLRRAAADLSGYAWMICASARAVDAVVQVRSGPWPRGLRSAAVGESTARALVEAGADPPAVVAREPGSEALTRHLLPLDSWPGRRVFIPRAKDGRRDLVESLRANGALVDDIEAYRMRPRAGSEIREAWAAARPDATVIASPQVAEALVRALGARTLQDLKAVVAIGATTAAALAAHGIDASVPRAASFTEAARCLAELASRRG